MKNKKKFMIGAYSVGLTAIVVAVVIALNLLVGQLPATFTKLDASPEKVLSIGADTKTVLKSVETDITIYHIFSEAEDPSITGILERYEAASSKIKVEAVDPVEKPTFTAQYTDAALTENSLIVVSDKRSTVVDGNDYYMYEVEGYEGQYLTYSEYSSYSQQMYYYYGESVNATEYFFAENEITGAIDYVSHDDLPVIYSLAGHNETSLASGSYGQLIADENVELKDLEMLSGETVAVPEDASALLINSPTADITAAESEAIISYLNGGGKVILMSFVDYYSKEAMPNLAAVCSHMGLEAIEELIVESDENGYYQYPYYLLPTLTGSGITQSYTGTNLYLFMIASHAIRSTGEGENVSVVPLLETTDSSYIYTEENAKTPDSAEKQTFSVAYESTLTDEEGNAKGTLYWFATPYFLSDDFIGYGNGELFTTLLTETCEKPTAVSVIGKALTQSYLELTESTSAVWSAVLVGIIPAAILVCGFVVWFRRRRR